MCVKKKEDSACTKERSTGSVPNPSQTHTIRSVPRICKIARKSIKAQPRLPGPQQRAIKDFSASPESTQRTIQPNKQLTLEPNLRQKPNPRAIDPRSCTALLTLEKPNPCTLANPRTPLDRTEPVYLIRTNTYPNFNQYIVTTKVGFFEFFFPQFVG
jgi:hypothetical protein